jgi:hypothetical protein
MQNQSTLSNFQKHLYFENFPNSKEFQLDKCNKILEMIAKLTDRNDSITEYSLKFYGVNANGNIRTTEREMVKYQNNLKTIERLKNYFNASLSQISQF